MTRIEFKDVMRRVALVIGAESDAAIAQEIDVSRQALSNSKKRGTIPYDRLCTLAIERQISLDYLLLGRGGPYVAGGHIDLSLFEQISSEVAVSNKELTEHPQAYVNFVGLVYEGLMRLPETQRQEAIPQEVNYLMRAFIKGTQLS